MARRRGGQPGNTNAAGPHKPGSGPPRGNTNALKHGGYAAVTWDSLTAQELEMLSDMPTDPKEVLTDMINLLTVRERRFMHRIAWVRGIESGLVVSSTVCKVDMREFDSEADRQQYEAAQDLPGWPSHEITLEESTENVAIRMENALTRCQCLKQKAIVALSRLHPEADKCEVAELLKYMQNEQA